MVWSARRAVWPQYACQCQSVLHVPDAADALFMLQRRKNVLLAAVLLYLRIESSGPEAMLPAFSIASYGLFIFWMKIHTMNL